VQCKGDVRQTDRTQRGQRQKEASPSDQGGGGRGRGGCGRCGRGQHQSGGDQECDARDWAGKGRV
jgi:hypothetical protein